MKAVTLSIKTEFERTVPSLSTKELVELLANGDTPNDTMQKVCIELDKRKVNLHNVKSYI